ncbi:hypothetical protein PVAP13_1NG248600 [Panicum virgatum]|uniref:Uncharacterized protein n=1 Tax=Panicum virgatum TaxID=38727 RepID=A0A8T0WZR3_PANVG|nr:hypothetical protein PVAP13_1NG248600 [Panicum virgatum]
MQAGQVSPQTRWANPRREPANRRNSARMGEAALCGLLAGPNGAAKPAKRKGEEAVRRPHLLDSSHAPPPPSTSAPPQSPFAAPPPVASGSTTLVASGSGGFLSHPPLVAVESSNPNRKNIIESTARVAVTWRRTSGRLSCWTTGRKAPATQTRVAATNKVLSENNR